MVRVTMNEGKLEYQFQNEEGWLLAPFLMFADFQYFKNAYYNILPRPPQEVAVAPKQQPVLQSSPASVPQAKPMVIAPRFVNSVTLAHLYIEQRSQKRKTAFWRW